MNNKIDCPICYNSYEISQIPGKMIKPPGCIHFVCVKCMINQIQVRRRTCAMCRARIPFTLLQLSVYSKTKEIPPISFPKDNN